MFIVLSVILILVIFKVITVLTNFQCTENTCLVGKVAIVTGGNSGIGFQTVINLASRGCRVIIADISNGEDVVAKIKEVTGNQDIFWRFVDLGSLQSVRKFAAIILQTESKLDLLINNAGCGGFDGFTEDGLLKIMQINYFGHFLLTHLLVELLKKSEKSRIVSVSSGLAFVHGLNTPKAINTEVRNRIKLLRLVFEYGNSKLCILIAMKLMAEKLKHHGISCYSVHPGTIQTLIYKASLQNYTVHKFTRVAYLEIIKRLLFIVGKSPREGAQTTLHCALSRKVEALSGKHFWNGFVFWEPAVAKNKEFCEQVWEESEKLVQLEDGEKLG